MKRFSLQRKHWLRIAVIAVLVLPGLLYFSLARTEPVTATIVRVSEDSDGDWIVKVRLQNHTEGEVVFPGNAADFLFHDVLAPGEIRRGKVGWCGTESVAYWTLGPGEIVTTRALVSKAHRYNRVRLAFFREENASNFADTAMAASKSLPMADRLKVMISLWSQRRFEVKTRAFVPSKEAAKL